MLMLPKRRCFHSTRFFGLWADGRKRAASNSLRSLFPKVVKAYLIGEASELFAQTIGNAFPYEVCETLETAVPRAASDAAASGVADPVVLLSPACASFDQFPDFEKRGDRFRELVKALLADVERRAEETEMVSRAERSAPANWWWTIDRWMLASVGSLMVLGLVLTMAGSPPVAERLGLSTFHFVHRQVLYLLPSIVVLVAASFLSPRQVRRVALLVFLVSMTLIIVALLYGHEVKGSRRWIFGLQPSEFLKPAFVILVAWAFSEGGQRRDLPGNIIAGLLLPITIIPLILTT